jgi:imidazolonepropionase-like amidohydrolase
MFRRLGSPDRDTVLAALLATVTLGLLPGLALTLAGCGPRGESSPAAGEAGTAGSPISAYFNATLIDGTGSAPLPGAVLLVRDGHIERVGPADAVDIPEGAERVDLGGKFVIPGLIDTHVHVGDTLGLETGHYSTENILRQLALYARYGVTTVNSLGDDRAEAIEIRDSQNTAGLDRARIFVGGTVVTGDTAEEALAIVEENAAVGVDWIKFRVDDNLGTVAKMSPEVYQPVIERAHELGLPVAAHVYYLGDAKLLLESGIDFVAHSIRDVPVDEETIALFAERDACYCPTLTRELSTFVYEEIPEFFEDPFFRAEVDDEIISRLSDPVRRQSVRESRAAQLYKAALPVAAGNLKALTDAGVRIAFGTDSGPPARFQGYFEHVELAMMAEAGLTPEQILKSATVDAAACLGLDDVGTLEAGKWADFIVLGADPLADIRNSRTIEAVYIAGNLVPTNW